MCGLKVKSVSVKPAGTNRNHVALSALDVSVKEANLLLLLSATCPFITFLDFKTLTNSIKTRLARLLHSTVSILFSLRTGSAVAQWLRCCATIRKVAGSIPDGVSGFFIGIKSFRSHYGPGVDSASNRNEYQEYFLGVKAAGA